jgi:hypothetical protein
MYIYFILLFIIIFIIIFVQKYNIYVIEKFNSKVLSQKKFDKFILNKPSNKSYKIGLKDVKIQRENCFQKCNAQDCIKLYMKTKNYNRCNECQKDEKKCYNKLYTLGDCNTCGENLKRLNCNHKNDIGCTNPDDIFGLDGVEPYYVEVASNNSNSPFDKKCIFCWELDSFI